MTKSSKKNKVSFIVKMLAAGLGKRLLFLTMFPIILNSIVLIVIYNEVDNLNLKLNGLLSNQVPAITTSMEFKSYTNKLEGVFWNIKNQGVDADDYIDLVIESETAVENLELAFSRYKDYEMEATASALREKLFTQWAEMSRVLKPYLQNLNDSDLEAAEKIYLEKFVPINVMMRDLISAIELNNTDSVEKYKQDATSKARIILFVGFSLSVLLSILVSFVIIWRLVKTINEMSVSLRDGSESIRSSSESLALVSRELSDSSTVAANSVEQLTTSVHEISSMMEQSEKSAQTTLGLANQNLSAVQDGKSAIQNIVSSVQKINGVTDDFTHVVNSNNEELKQIIGLIEQIAEKAKAIDQIVFQTKLLSFNASVEASRAGEHGKGFAVVAQEIGALAANSGKAAQEIEDLISQGKEIVSGTIEKAISNLSSITSALIEQVQSSQGFAMSGIEKLENIQGKSNELNNVILSITNAIEEQTKAINEVNKSMSQLGQVADSTSGISKNVENNVAIGLDQAQSISEVVQRLSLLVGANKGLENSKRS